MAWTDIPASVYAVGKPITSVSYGYLKDNGDYLKALFDAATGHKHTGAADDAPQIPQGGLKTATHEIFTSVTVNLIMNGGEYGFYPRLKGSAPGDDLGAAQISLRRNNLGTSYITSIHVSVLIGTIYVQQRYIQASPPYKIGNTPWGHFLYMLINSNGDVISASEAEDPPYAYNGPFHNTKDSIERIQAVPHPFADYWDKDPAIDGLEIVLVDLREHDTKKWKADNAKQGRGILEDLGHINKGGQIVTPQELGIDNIQGFTDKVKIRKHN